jgi:hypothetical protein
VNSLHLLKGFVGIVLGLGSKGICTMNFLTLLSNEEAYFQLKWIEALGNNGGTVTTADSKPQLSMRLMQLNNCVHLPLLYGNIIATTWMV